MSGFEYKKWLTTHCTHKPLWHTFKIPLINEGEFMSTSILSLDRAIQNTIQWIVDIQDELGWESRDTVYRATKAVLQTTRDRLPFEEMVHFSANLPLIMKGMLMDGYDIRDKPVKMRSVEEFFEYVQQYYDAQRRDIISADDAVRAVVVVLNRRMGGGEMQKVAANMPEKIRRLFETAASQAEIEMPSEAEIPMQ